MLSNYSRYVASFFILFSVAHSVHQDYPGKLHIGLDGWTSPNVILFLGVVVYLVHDGAMTSMILDFLKYALQSLLTACYLTLPTD